jgi:hypothetical protein
LHTGDADAAHRGLDVINDYDAANVAVPQVLGLRGWNRSYHLLRLVLLVPLLFCYRSPRANVIEPQH